MEPAEPTPDRFPPVTAVVFAYNERASLARLLPRLLAEPLARIVLVYGGSDGSRELVDSIDDPRLVRCFEEERAGKWKAFNRSLREVEGEIVLFVSGDVQVPAGIVRRIVERFVPGVGVVIPRVLPRNRANLIARLGRVLWDLHDVELAYLDERGANVHGGELLAVRRSALSPVPAVINEDAYLCLEAGRRGFGVAYARELTIENTVPETLPELLRQRARVNYGHSQLLSMGLDPRVLDSMFLRARGEFGEILLRFARSHPRDVPLLPLLALLEIVALWRGGADFRRRVDYTRWPIVSSGKAEPSP